MLRGQRRRQSLGPGAGRASAPCTPYGHAGPPQGGHGAGLHALLSQSGEILDHFTFDLVKSEGTLASKRVRRGAVPGVSVRAGGLEAARAPVLSVGTPAAGPSPTGLPAPAAVADAAGGGSRGGGEGSPGGAALACTLEDQLACLSPEPVPGAPANIKALLALR